MADETPDFDVNEGDEPQGGPPRTSLLGKLQIAAFVLAVVLVECLIMYWLLPSEADTAARAESTLASSLQDAQPDEDQESSGEEAIDQVEVDLEVFSVTSYHPTSNATLRIDFHLYGTVGAEHEQEFLRLKEENLHRFREQVIVTVRAADVSDLTDAGLGLVKRKIREKTNRILGKPLLQRVIFSDFSVIEQ